MQIQGVVKLHGTSLKYLKTFARDIPAPEGIVFAHKSVYVVRYVVFHLAFALVLSQDKMMCCS